MRGALRWRAGEWNQAERSCRRAHELAEQVGRSEVAFSALRWLAAVQRDRGDHVDAELTLSRALDVCERAGLVAQSLEATAERAICLHQAGRAEQALEAAEGAGHLAERLHYPVGTAAAGEAAGATMADPEAGAGALAGAREAWEKLGLPIDAARAEMLRAARLAEVDVEAARAAAEQLERRCTELGIAHMAARAQALVPAA